MGQQQMQAPPYGGAPPLNPGTRASGSTTPPMPSGAGPAEPWRGSTLPRGEGAPSSAAPHEVLRQVPPASGHAAAPGTTSDLRNGLGAAPPEPISRGISLPGSQTPPGPAAASGGPGGGAGSASLRSAGGVSSGPAVPPQGKS